MRSLPLEKTTAFTSGCSNRMPQQRVGELDVDSEVVRVELERIARAQPFVLANVEDELGDRAAVLARELEAPVAIALERPEPNRRQRRARRMAGMAVHFVRFHAAQVRTGRTARQVV